LSGFNAIALKEKDVSIKHLMAGSLGTGRRKADIFGKCMVGGGGGRRGAPPPRDNDKVSMFIYRLGVNVFPHNRDVGNKFAICFYTKFI